MGKPPSIAQWQETRILCSTRADVNLVAIHKLVKFGLKRIQKILHGAREAFHFFGSGNPAAERLDVDVDERARIGGLADVLLEFGGATVRFAQARSLVHFKVQLDKKAAFEMVRR